MTGLTVHPAVTADKFDGEIVLIHIQSGLYFSLRGAAVSLWEAMKAPIEASSLLAMFGKLPASEAAKVEATLRLFQERGLVVESEGPFSTPSTVAYEGPVVESYDDLADLITLDPIHDVGVKGWPHAASGERSAAS